MPQAGCFQQQELIFTVLGAASLRESGIVGPGEDPFFWPGDDHLFTVSSQRDEREKASTALWCLPL